MLKPKKPKMSFRDAVLLGRKALLSMRGMYTGNGGDPEMADRLSEAAKRLAQLSRRPSWNR